MKITITKEFDTIEEAIEFLTPFVAAGMPPMAAPGNAPLAPAVITTDAPKRRGRPRKTLATPTPTPAIEPAAAPADAQAAAPVVATPTYAAPAPDAVRANDRPEPKDTGTPVNAATGPAPAAAPTATKDEAMAALRTLFNTKGAAAATELLTKFGVTRFSELPPEQYGAFVAAGA